MIQAVDITGNVTASNIRDSGTFVGNSTGTDQALYVAVSGQIPVYLALVVYEDQNYNAITFFSSSSGWSYLYQYTESSTISGNYSVDSSATYTEEGKGVWIRGVLVRNTPYNPANLPVVIRQNDAQVNKAIWDLLYTEAELYPITYSATNGTVTGPEEAAIGETVVATGTPNAGYGITDYTTQISVTNNDIPVSFTYNATTNEITFEMPDPTSS